MRQYVDINQDADWSEADVENRGVARLAAEFPDRLALMEAAQAMSLGQGILTVAEQQRSRALFDLRTTIRAEVEAAKARMVLLRQAWAVEAAQRVLLGLPLDVIEPDDPPDVVAEKEAANELRQAVRDVQQAVIDAAPPDVMAIVAQRNRYPTPPPEATP